MKRVVFSLFLAIFTLVGLIAPLFRAIPESASESSADPVTITDYTATYDVSADGLLTARETVTTAFPSGRHGIFRFWDITDPADARVRYEPENIEVTYDGGPVPVEIDDKQGHRFVVAKIGDPGRYVPQGVHTYVITYTVRGALAPGTSDQSSSGSRTGEGGSHFLWRIVADGWQMPIQRSTTTVTLPSEPVSAACSIGTREECVVTEQGPTTRVVTTGPLPPMIGVSFRADLAGAAPPQITAPWPQPLDLVLGRSPTVVIVLLLVSALTFALGVYWVLRSREATPLLPVMYEPPRDPGQTAGFLGPVQTYYVTREAAPARGLVATLLHMADRDLVRLQRSGDDWTITSQIDAVTWSTADPVSQAVATALGLGGKGSSFHADGSVSAGRQLNTAKGAAAGAAATWAVGSGVLAHSRSEKTGRWLVVLAVAAAIAAVFLAPFSLWLLPFAAFAVGGAGLFVSGVGTRRTPLGRDVWSRAGGFERLLSTPSNVERLDFSARRELYTDYIPYAVAFDCADAWARKYRIATGAEPPQPVWLVSSGSGSSHGLFGGGGGIDSFESSLSSALSAYSASQSSSSSSSGGG
ncbi:DUF2207 domain-containing protein, partial [Gordonia desulfuricans]